MEQIVLNWQGPVKFSEWKTISKEKGIYFHTVITNVNERITYVGKGDIYDCQERHWGKLRDANCGFYDYLKIKDFDFYEFYSNDKYVNSVYNLINIHPSVNLLNWRKSKGEDYFAENLTSILENSYIYYVELVDDENLNIIEANIQYYLIRKFKLDIYNKYEYKIGLCNNRTCIDKNVIIENNFQELVVNNLEFINSNFDYNSNYILDFRNDLDELIEEIKYKTFDILWKDIVNKFRL